MKALIIIDLIAKLILIMILSTIGIKSNKKITAIAILGLIIGIICFLELCIAI